MKTILSCVFLFSVLCFPQLSVAEKDCSCPKVTCGPCQKQITIGKVVKFCDWGDINVCRKVVCENVNSYFSCLTRLNKTENSAESGKPKADLELGYGQEQAKKGSSQQEARAPASVIKKKRQDKVQLVTEGRVPASGGSRIDEGEIYSDQVSGKVVKLSNRLELIHRGHRGPLTKDRVLYVGDEIENSGEVDSQLSLQYENGQVHLQLRPKSKLIVHDPHSIVGRFQPFIYLVHGGVDYKLDLKEGSFDLLAGQILTRASAGHHQVKYEMDAEGLKVRVESFANGVDVIRAKDLSGKTIRVEPGHFVSWVSETLTHLFTADEKAALASEGFITPVFAITESRRRELGLIPPPSKPLFEDWSQSPEKDRGLASVGDELCQAPAASFQQCAWTCEGNAKGASFCEAQKDEVHCVRRICNAAGQWGGATAFASSYKDLCPAEGVRVGDCSP